MKCNGRKTLSWLLALALALSLIPAAAMPARAATIDGSSVTWEWNSSTKTLTIGGSGAMPEYDSAGLWPWYSVCGLTVEKVVIGAGVTSIGEEAFDGEYDDDDAYGARYQNLSSVVFEVDPVTQTSGVTEIKNKAFFNCTALEEIRIPEGVQRLGIDVFATKYNSYANPQPYESSLKTVYLPRTLQEIGGGAFYLCGALTDVYYGGTSSEWTSKVTIRNQNESLTSIISANDGHMHYSDKHQVGSDPVYLEAYAGAALPTQAGRYYLTGDYDLDATWAVPSGTTYLCLNGHSITLDGSLIGAVIKVDSGSTLYLFDCADNADLTGHAAGPGTVTRETGGESGIGVWVKGSGQLHMYGGTVTGNSVGVWAESSAAVTVNGGAITANSGDGIESKDNSTVVVTGGTISDNVIGIYSAKSVEISGGLIKDNAKNGVKCAGSITVSGGEISGNGKGTTDADEMNGVYGEGLITVTDGIVSDSGGNGIFGYTASTVSVSGGSIFGNGGHGIYNSHSVTFGGTAVISGNGGDGIFCKETSSSSAITGGLITGNTGYAVSARNLSISGAPDLSGNTAGGIYVRSGDMITIAGALTPYNANAGSGAHIGVTMQSPGVFTSGLGVGTSNVMGTLENFFSDDADCVVALSGTEAALLPRESTPTATFTATGADCGTLTGLVSGADYTVSGAGLAAADVSADANGEYAISSDLTAGTLSVVKKGDGSTTADSAEQTFSLTKAATPALTATQPAVIGGTGSIPTTSEHEYNTDNGSTWAACGGELTGLDPGTYYVRVAANGTVLASAPQSIGITAFDANSEPTPTATFTATGADCGTLTGLVSGADYTISGAGLASATVTADANGEYAIASGLKAGTLSVVKKGDGTTTTDSAAQTIAVTKAATPALTATQPTTVDGTGSIPTTSAHELKKSGGSWGACTGKSTGLPVGTYYVRVAANGTVLASPAQKLVISAGTVCTVTFKANGGSGTMPDQTLTVRIAAILKKNTFTREGYTFTGWNTASDGSGTAYADRARLALRGSATLYAQWKETDPNAPVIEDVVADREEASVGETVTWTATASGGVGKLTYCFYIYRDGLLVEKGRASASCAYGFSNTYTYAPTEPGNYTARVFVRDGARTVVALNSDQVTVDGGPLRITSVTTDSPDMIFSGSITWTAEAEGGARKLAYCFYVYRNGTLVERGRASASCAYGFSNTYTYTPTVGGCYTVRAFVRDATGLIVSSNGPEVWLMQ